MCVGLGCFMAVTAGAHENAEFHLAGLTFCVDDDSVQVTLDIPDANRAVSARAALTRALAEQLEALTVAYLGFTLT